MSTKVQSLLTYCIAPVIISGAIKFAATSVPRFLHVIQDLHAPQLGATEELRRENEQ